MDEQELKKLKRKRGSIKQKLTCFISFFDKISTSFDNNDTIGQKTIIDLQQRVENLRNLNIEYDEVQLIIEENCNDSDLEDEYEERFDVTELHSGYLASATLILTKLVPNENDNDESVSNISNNNKYDLVKLPPVDIPSFNGEFSNWMEYKETFDTLINQNVSLNDIQRFHYLRTSLGPDVKKILKNLEFSKDNYKIAWQVLCKRFDNPMKLVNTHIKALFNLNSLQKESASSIRELVDSASKHLHVLKTLNLSSESLLSQALLNHIISEKLDKATFREWEQKKVKDSLPAINDLFQFLESKADFLENCEQNSTSKPQSFDNSQKRPIRRHVSLISSDVSPISNHTCHFCNNSHLIYYCKQFLSLDINQRWEKVKALKLCTNCLCKGHFSKDCTHGQCKTCKGKHNSLLHQYSQRNANVATPQESNVLLSSKNENPLQVIGEQNFSNNITTNQVEVEDTKVVTFSKLNSNYVLLSTAIVHIYDEKGNVYEARAILDSGSQSSFITNDLCRKLGLKQTKTNISIVGINKVSSMLNSKCNITIKSKYNDSSFQLLCFILPKITDNLPIVNFDISNLQLPQHVPLADPSFNKSGSIDILIGADLFWDILIEGKIKLGKNLPVLQNTSFGYVISGPWSQTSNKIHCFFVQKDQFHTELEQFWTIEEIPHTQLISQEDEFCEEHFKKTYSRNKDGKFIVRIPLKSSRNELGDSKTLALNRFLSLEKRFANNQQLKELYISFMQEYQSLNHMSIDLTFDENIPSYFLPHHGVLKSDSLTTKLRVVFNGSASTTSGSSLNTIQYSGPAIQNYIFEILLRFRLHKYVVISDIEKMYRCVLIHPDDRHLQKILWRENSTDSISIMTLNTVTYGTSSAPFLAMRCLRQLSYDVQNSFPLEARIILIDFYVDDLISGINDKQLAQDTCKNISEILLSGGFNLRKWVSNDPEIVKQLKIDSDNFSVLNLGNNDPIKTLGIQWIPNLDVLSFNIPNLSNIASTKRQILSDIAKMYRDRAS